MTDPLTALALLIVAGIAIYHTPKAIRYWTLYFQEHHHDSITKPPPD